MTLNPGLEGINVAKTKLSLVDGQNGRLVYNGFWAKELALNKKFEEVMYLHLYGKIPDSMELEEFEEKLRRARSLPEYLKKVIITLPKEIDYMSFLRTAISSIKLSTDTWPPNKEQAIEVLAKIPTLITYRYNFVNNKNCIEPDNALSHTENYLYMLHNRKPTEAHAKALDAYLILTSEHGMNASTFTSRVITSTQSDIISAIVGAIGALKGPLHGGAPSEVDDMLENIGTKDNVEPWLRSKLNNGDRLMGFGHRVYKTYDPRAEALKIITSKFSSNDPLFELGLYVEKKALEPLEEYKPGRKLYTNVEFYAAAVLRAVGLPKELYTPTFALSRTAGWTANILEQANDNRLIRPSTIYVGEIPEA